MQYLSELRKNLSWILNMIINYEKKNSFILFYVLLARLELAIPGFITKSRRPVPYPLGHRSDENIQTKVYLVAEIENGAITT